MLTRNSDHRSHWRLGLQPLRFPLRSHDPNSLPPLQVRSRSPCQEQTLPAEDDGQASCRDLGPGKAIIGEHGGGDDELGGVEAGVDDKVDGREE